MRLKDWPSRFAALVAEPRPFAWGENDCCLWAADAVLALTGEDRASAYRGVYSDARGALRVLESLGGLEGAAALAGPEIAPAFATVGDVGLIDAGAEDGSLSLGVCGGDIWLCVGESGLLRFPYAAAKRTWRTT